MPDHRENDYITATDTSWAPIVDKILQCARKKLAQQFVASKLFELVVGEWREQDNTDHVSTAVGKPEKPHTRHDLGKELNLSEKTDFPQTISRAACDIRDILDDCCVGQSISITLMDRTYLLLVKLKRTPRAIRMKPVDHVIGMLVANPNDWCVSPIVSGADKILRAAGYDLLLVGTDNNALTESSCLDHMRDLADGIIAIPVWDEDTHGAYARLLESSFPLVFVDRLIRNFDGWLPVVTSDNVAGGYQATKYLIEKYKCKRVHLLSEYLVSSLTQRKQGYRKAIENAHASGLVWTAPDRENENVVSWAFRQTTKLIKEGTIAEGDGIFALTDNVAAGCRAAVETLNLQTPVVGFDGQYWGAYLSPPLETIRQDMPAMGAEAARILVRKIYGASVPKTTYIPVKLLTAEERLQSR